MDLHLIFGGCYWNGFREAKIGENDNETEFDASNDRGKGEDSSG